MACRSLADAARRGAAAATLATLAALLDPTTIAASQPASLPQAAPRLPAAEPDSPLLAYAATLDAASLPDAAARLGELRSAENALRRARSPAADCAASLGAARFGALHAEIAFARQAVGDRAGALDAWTLALDCAPRNAGYRVALGNLLLTFARFEAAREQLERAAQLAPQRGGLDELRAWLDYVERRWPEAARHATQIAARREAQREAAAAAGLGASDAAGMPQLAAAGDEAAFWRLLALLAQRRQGLPQDGTPAPDLGLEDRWPVPLWRYLHDEIDEAGIVAAIAARGEARQRREMTCEALYYTAQAAFADGRADEGRRRLATAVNLKVVYYVEHDLALAELARLRPN